MGRQQYQAPNLPAIWNVPLRNLNFTGREHQLAELHTALESGQTAALTQPQAIHGLGGIGKTQLAIEYAYRYAAGYSLAWWLRAEETATLAADYAALAQPLALEEKDAAEQPLVIAAVRRWLEGHTNWLLVFDNADRPAELDPYLPHGSGGHILITSRNPNWRGRARPLLVETMPRTEAIDLLLKRTGHTDRAAAGKLAETLGDFPLALEQAGAYIETMESP